MAVLASGYREVEEPFVVVGAEYSPSTKEEAAYFDLAEEAHAVLTSYMVQADLEGIIMDYYIICCQVDRY